VNVNIRPISETVESLVCFKCFLKEHF